MASPLGGQQGLSSLLGAGLGQGLAQACPNDFFQREMNLAAMQGACGTVGATTTGDILHRVTTYPASIETRKKTIREELQTETNEWLKDTI